MKKLNEALTYTIEYIRNQLLQASEVTSQRDKTQHYFLIESYLARVSVLKEIRDEIFGASSDQRVLKEIAEFDDILLKNNTFINDTKEQNEKQKDLKTLYDKLNKQIEEYIQQESQKISSSQSHPYLHQSITTQLIARAAQFFKHHMLFKPFSPWTLYIVKSA